MGQWPRHLAAPAVTGRASPIATFSGVAMGGGWTLRQPAAVRSGAAEVQAALDLVDAQMSAWKPGSALSRLNAAPVGDWMPIPPEMGHVLQAGLDLMQIAPGAFSVLMGGASAAAGFQPGQPCAPGRDPGVIEVAPGQARRMADVAVDLNAIAKGFAADLAGHLLVQAGHSDFLIEVAGDILAKGQRPDGLPWTAAVELPIPGRSVPARLLPVCDAGLAGSGGYRRARGGVGHILDPATGKPLPATMPSVAVLARTAMESDGWATVLSVLGPRAGLALAAERQLPALFISPAPDGGGFVETGSPTMSALLFSDPKGGGSQPD